MSSLTPRIIPKGISYCLQSIKLSIIGKLINTLALCVLEVQIASVRSRKWLAWQFYSLYRINNKLVSLSPVPYFLMPLTDIDLWHMRRALELAAGGQGYVEPNPLVGCVIARGAEIIGEGWHRRFGGPHAEVEALRLAAQHAAGSTLYITLEPCCHFGKTPPCTQAILAAGVRRVVVAQRDPFPQVSGGGLAELETAGVEVELGALQAEARWLNAPYLKLIETGRPWIIAKWAMSLDGKIATSTGESRWISNTQSRQAVHKLRGAWTRLSSGAKPRSATIRC